VLNYFVDDHIKSGVINNGLCPDALFTGGILVEQIGALALS